MKHKEVLFQIYIFDRYFLIYKILLLPVRCSENKTLKILQNVENRNFSLQGTITFGLGERKGSTKSNKFQQILPDV